MDEVWKGTDLTLNRNKQLLIQDERVHGDLRDYGKAREGRLVKGRTQQENMTG